MTVFETWLTETVKNVVRDAEKEMEPDWSEGCAPPPGTDYETNYREYWRLFEQRAAVILVQARAQECRHFAGMLMIRNQGNMTVKTVCAHLNDRSHWLEEVAMRIAQPAGWPLVEGVTAEEPSRIIQ